MAGFLDPKAPSVEAEYVRYLEGDIFGKILFQNFAMNIWSLKSNQIKIPIGRYGDIGADATPRADALVLVGKKWLDVEIKFCRINIANKTRGDTEHNWAFTHILKTPAKEEKKFDILFAVGAEILGLEHPDYWSHLAAVSKAKAKKGIQVGVNALPHQKEYLNLCGTYIMPFHAIPTNHFRVTLGAIKGNHLFNRFSWGWDVERCRKLWHSAVAEALKGS